jgi:hypothetical protein
MFSKEDFNSENAQRLSVIIMTQMRENPLTLFKTLPDSKKAKFNRLLNEYIQKELQREDWMDTLLRDFNRIVNEDILNEDFDPSKEYVPIYNTDRVILNPPPTNTDI